MEAGDSSWRELGTRGPELAPRLDYWTAEGSASRPAPSLEEEVPSSGGELERLQQRDFAATVPPAHLEREFPSAPGAFRFESQACHLFLNQEH